MIRNMCWLTTILSTMALPVAAPAASITGNVFQDRNADGIFNLGEGLSGISVDLYEDDGDGFLGANDRARARRVVSSSGAYTFDNLATRKAYFVVPASSAGREGSVFAASVPTLIRPGTPRMLIDDFGTTQIVSATPLSTMESSSVAGDNILGGERDMFVELLSGKADAKLRVRPYGLRSVLQFDQAAGVMAEATIRWDGQRSSANGLGNLDLTNGGLNTGFEIRLGVDVAGTTDSFKLRLFNSSIVGHSEAVLPFPVTNGTAIVGTLVPFSAFVGDVSPSDVDAIQFSVGGTSPSVDLQLEYIGIVGPHVNDIVVASVPEPSTMIPTGVGLFLIGLLRSARKQRSIH